MLRIEILNSEGKILKSHRIMTPGLHLIGKNPNAQIHIRGNDIGNFHLALKAPEKSSDFPVLMDLGGPTPLKINGQSVLEKVLTEESSLAEIGRQKIRIIRDRIILPDIKIQKWEPVLVDELFKLKASKEQTIRIRLFKNHEPVEVKTCKDSFVIDSAYELSAPHQLIQMKSKKPSLILPKEWVVMGGRVQIGKDKIESLNDYLAPKELEIGQIYRFYAGRYLLEVLASEDGLLKTGLGRFEGIPKDLRKPLFVSSFVVSLLVGISFLLSQKTETKIEEPYPVYARIQNIPIERLPEVEKLKEENAGGGPGSNLAQNSASSTGAATPSNPSKLAQNLTGGLKNLVGNILNTTKSNTSAVVAETGISSSAAAQGLNSGVSGKLASVGSGQDKNSGAANLGNLGIAGSGKGFSGGSGTGLGIGSGSGVGSGVGEGIGGRGGGFKIIEEESIVDGGLDKSVIAAVIQNNLNQIKYCYERQLVAQPDLFGKVVVLWNINGSGIVENASIKQSTLGSNPVEQCMISKISNWKFPSPKNGSKVTVSYPFLFKSTK